MAGLAPGTLLQLMYLNERLREITPGRFIEVGPGSGEITRLLLDLGWKGCSYDIDGNTISALRSRFSAESAENRYRPINEDYLTCSVSEEKVDLVISCMVMEHLSDEAQFTYMQKSKECLKKNGLMIGLVPASPSHWGVEDDIAGHLRRYTRKSLKNLIDDSQWRLLHIAGLTYPISNWLLPISNFLVNRSEKSKLSLSTLERTKQSGRRTVKFKTHFPAILAKFLNRYTLYPLHILQKIFTESESSLVLYFETKPSTEKI